MKLPRKLKKGVRAMLYKRDTKWKRKATTLVQKEVKGFAFAIDQLSKPLDLPLGGIVSDKPISGRGEYVMGKEEQERMIAMLQQPMPETIHATINLDNMPMADKLKLLKR